MFVFVSVHKRNSLPFIFKRLLYYLFSWVSAHNRGIHASDWFISRHCFLLYMHKKVVLFSLVVSPLRFAGNTTKLIQQVKPVDRYFLPGGTRGCYPTIFPCISRIGKRFARNCVDTVECAPANLIGLRINYRPGVSIICFKRLYWFYSSTTQLHVS